ncbi:triosephosphate isomerase [Gluconobacter cerinus]|uniref:triose-phosphate isomerase n=1 Tax=Gluconobacter cerinus TaxID=38307 RepID=UPI00222725C9|nr:triose-phosphate isomerase [Gluconobacter cerinus]MCW2264318.1 triosephosphate isomerase [Gluconobacter cerinus]
MVTRKTVWIGTNWKMNKGPAEALAAAEALKAYRAPEGVKPFIITPFTSLQAVASVLKDADVLVGAQNMHWEESGSWTGEISPGMVKECGADIVLIGHSERRQHFAETDWTVSRKMSAALRHGLRPLLCIGESLEEYDFGVTAETLSRQLKIALHDVVHADLPNILIAYEPVWAIGAGGRAADTDCVAKVHAGLRAVLCEIAGKDIGDRVPLLYGGSVTQDNARSYVSQPNVDGVFVGRAGWSVPDFEKLIDRVIEERAPA